MHKPYLLCYLSRTHFSPLRFASEFSICNFPFIVVSIHLDCLIHFSWYYISILLLIFVLPLLAFVIFFSTNGIVTLVSELFLVDKFNVRMIPCCVLAGENQSNMRDEFLVHKWGKWSLSLNSSLVFLNHKKVKVSLHSNSRFKV